jgi:hypothetical protein
MGEDEDECGFCDVVILYYVTLYYTSYHSFCSLFFNCYLLPRLFLSLFPSLHHTLFPLPSLPSLYVLYLLFSSILGVVCWWIVLEDCAMLTTTSLISSTRYGGRSTSRPLL